MSIDTSRPRATAGYDFAGQSQINTSQADNHILLRSAHAETWGPSWQNTLTTFRPTPVKQLDGTLTPYRLSTNNNAFGPWIQARLCFRGGQSGSMVSFLLHDPNDGTEFDPQNSPPFVLYNAINSAVNAGQERPGWGALIKGGPGKPAALSRPKMMYYMQGYLLENKNKVFPGLPRGLKQNDRVIVFGIPAGSPTAVGNKLLNMLNQVKPEQAAQTADMEAFMEQQMYFGNPIAFNYGRFFRFCEAGGQLTNVAQPGYANAGGQNTNQQGADKGYDVSIVSEVYGVPATLPQEFVQSMIDRTIPWENVFNYVPVEEQVAFLARAYYGDVIEYAFSDRPQWLTQDVLSITRVRMQVQSAGVPNGGAAAAYGAAYGGQPQGGYNAGGYTQPQPQTQPQYVQPQPQYVQPPQQQPQYVQPQQQPQSQYVDPLAQQPVATPPVQPVQTPTTQPPSWGGTPYGQPGMDSAVRPGTANMPTYTPPIQHVQPPVQTNVNPAQAPFDGGQTVNRADALAAAQRFLPQPNSTTLPTA